MAAGRLCPQQALLVLALIMAPWSPPVQAHGERPTPCARSAQDMFHSCGQNSHADLFATVANCRQLDAAADRRACRLAAMQQKQDDRQTCREQRTARGEACELLGERRYLDPLVDPAIEFIDPDEIPSVYANNPFVLLQAGHTHVLSAEDELVVVHATSEVREIQGVLCRIVVDIVVESEVEEGEVAYEAVEVTDDWFAQDAHANVYYCGEVARNFEDGVLRDLEGSFESGIDFAKGGILTLAAPTASTAHRQEYALGEAEDIARYLELNATPSAAEGGENESFPCNGGCLKLLEFTPIEPDSSEFKYFLAGTGFVLAVALEDGEITGEREELVCTGSSLDVLQDPGCGIEDPAALLAELCDLHDVFCE